MLIYERRGNDIVVAAGHRFRIRSIIANHITILIDRDEVMSNKLKFYLLIGLLLFTSAGLSRESQASAFEIPKTLIQQLIMDINTNDKGSHLSNHDLEILRKNLKCKLEHINGDGAEEYFLYIDHPDWCGRDSSPNAYRLLASPLKSTDANFSVASRRAWGIT